MPNSWAGRIGELHETESFLRDPEDHNRVHKSPPLDYILSQLNPNLTLTLYLTYTVNTLPRKLLKVLEISK
jgi:hypothetical protein